MCALATAPLLELSGRVQRIEIKYAHLPQVLHLSEIKTYLHKYMMVYSFVIVETHDKCAASECIDCDSK